MKQSNHSYWIQSLIHRGRLYSLTVAFIFALVRCANLYLIMTKQDRNNRTRSISWYNNVDVDTTRGNAGDTCGVATTICSDRMKDTINALGNHDFRL